MGIQKQEFYEGAALHRLARNGLVPGIKYDHPFFVVNESTLLCLKYSTKGRSPWAFTFTSKEQFLLERRASEDIVVIGLICGSDGVAAITYEAYRGIAMPRTSPVHIACYRRHGQFYSITGPDGELDRKISPSAWQTILIKRGIDETP